MMKKQAKPTGLIGSVVADTQTQVTQREAKRSFVASWRQKHPDFGGDLEQLSKEELIDLYVHRVVGDVYDIAVSMRIGPAQSDIVDAAEILNLSDTLLRGTPDEARAAVKEWESKKIAAAGRDVAKVAEIARTAGATLARLDLNKFKRGLTLQGRITGGDSTKKKAAAHIDLIRASVQSILDNPANSGISDGEIATFLMTPPRSMHKTQGIERSRKTMMRYIAKIRDEFRNRNGHAG